MSRPFTRLAASPLTLLMTAFVITRLGMALLLLVDREVFGANDIWRYHAVAEEVWSTNRETPPWEYPLGSLLVTLPPLLLGGDGQIPYFVRFFAVSLVLDFVTFAALLRLAPRGSRNIAGAWVWVVSLPVLGLISLTRLDVASCACAALSLTSVARSKRVGRAAFFATLGASIKVWPVVILAALLGHQRERARWLLGTLTAVIPLLALAQLLGLWTLSTSFLEYQRDRGLQVESFAALPLLWLDRLGWAEYTVSLRFGAQQIDGPGTDVLAMTLTVAMVAMLLGLAYLARRPRFRMTSPPERLVVISMLGVCIFIVTNKVLSGQYLLWLIVMVSAFCAFRPIDRRAIAALVAACGLTHVAFPYMFRDLVDGGLAPVVVLSLRDMAIAYLIWRLVRPYLASGGGELTAESEPSREAQPVGS